MLDTYFDELDDAFIDEKVDAHSFIWEQLRALCRDAKLGKLSKACVCNIIKDGQQIKDTVKLRGLELDELPSNPDWIPKTMEKSDVKYFEHKITDKTKEYLGLFASFTVLRHKKYGESLAEENKKKIKEMEEANTDPKVLADAKESFEKAEKTFDEGTPECLEEVLYAALYPAIQQKAIANVDKTFDKENEEAYPKEEKPSK